MRILFDPVKKYAETTPKRTALGCVETGRRWTWAEFDAAANRIAAWLVDRYGPKSTVRIALLAKNHPNIAILQFACIRAGAILVPYNWRLAQSEILELMQDAQPKVMFCDPDFKFDALNDVVEVMALTDVETLGTAGAVPPADARQEWDQPSTLLYTSGTSGKPKGVMVTEENAFWGNSNFGLGSLLSYESSFLCDMPMFHTAGLFAATRVPILFGGTVWISSGFDPAKTIERIASPELKITHYFSVPQMATTLWQHPDFTPEKFAGLKMYVTGGAPNSRAQIERFAKAGIRFSDGFGMTETGSNFAMPVLDVERLIEKAGSCGIPLMTVQARIVDEDGNDVAQGEVGELYIRGPSVTPGYWNQPEVTAKSFDNGWFKTGDAARRDEDGFYYLVDRKKDMYISGGENVYPAEVERIIVELGDIADVAVIGIPSERWGEVGRAFISLKSGSTLTEQAIIDHCLKRLAKFKVPASVIITDQVPRTPSGKVQKHLLPRD
jgi:fatty-acyl-CoA synthase